MGVTLEDIRINGDRLWNTLMEMAKVGPGIAGGNNRQALTDEDSDGRQLFKGWCEAAGLSVVVDEMGNMFAQRNGVKPDACPVYIGSHLDTQPTGGRFDGVLGVLGGLEVVRVLNDYGIKTDRSIVLVNWTNEEGARFAPAMLSSGVFAGVYERDWAYDRVDIDGARFGDELDRIGWKGNEEVGHRPVHAFFELHIEQGPILEAEGKVIGIVTHAQGSSWIKVTVRGQEAHTGSTPMSMRKNAALGMARILQLVDSIAWSHEPHAVGAVGHIEVFPNSTNVVPGKAVFVVDFRSPSSAIIRDMEKQLSKKTFEVCREMGLELDFEKIGGFEPVTFDEDCIQTIRNAAESLNYSHRDIISGAGHDSCWLSRVAPTAMVMCPCVNGLSHNEAEEVTKGWASAGANVLLRAAAETAGVHVDNTKTSP